MELNQRQYETIAKYLPRQRGNVSMNNLQLVNAILYVLENGTQSIGRSRGGLTTQIHRVTASDRSAVSFPLSAGNAADSPEGRKLLNFTAGNTAHRHLLMDCALASSLGYTPVVPPKKNRKISWEYDHQLYRKRNEIKRFFLRIKRFRRIFTRYDKLDIIFAGFILFSMIIDSIV